MLPAVWQWLSMGLGFPVKQKNSEEKERERERKKEKERDWSSYIEPSISSMIYQMKELDYSVLGMQHWLKNISSAGNGTANLKCGQ